MNKHVYKLLVVTMVVLSCNQYKPNTFSVKGKVINCKSASVKLITFNNDSNIIVIDTALTTTNGKFLLTALATSEALYALKINDLPFVFLSNDAKEINIEIDAKQYNNYKISNSPNSQAIKEYFEKYQGFETAIVKAKDSIAKARKNNLSDRVINVLKQTEQTAINTLKTFCASSINQATGAALKYITIYYGFRTNNINNKQAVMYLNDAEMMFKHNKQILALKEKLMNEIAANPETILLDKPIIPFSITSTLGDTINTKQYVGKYVLIDFWASSNSAYRNETAQLYKTYKQFKDTNFSIIGICLDTNYKAAVKAIKQDSLVWKNSIDTLGLKSSVAKKYYVQTLPFNVLINPQQKIIGVNVRGNALKEKLKALYQR